MGTVTVRVVPRAGRTSVEVDDRGIWVRVRAAPEAGRATEEARRALARALGLRPSEVRLIAGARARQKVFELEGLDADRAEARLRAASRR